MTELILMIGVTGSGLLFALGGTYLKALRRFLMPIMLFICLILMGINIWLSAIAMGVLCGVLHLGYGESTPWWGKAVVAISYALPALIVGWTWWSLILPPSFLIMFLLSNIPIFSTSFTWKCVEIMTGTLIGISVLTAGLQPWV